VNTSRTEDPREARTIVVAEDDAVTARLVEGTLEAAGFRLVMAPNGQAAMRAVLSEKPDVLILDLEMPGMGGFDVLQRLNMLTAMPRPKVLVMSTDREVGDITRALELGADDYLAKPFQAQDLLARVNRFI
jgi:two-component system KDP operon response regulator KdpE